MPDANPYVSAAGDAAASGLSGALRYTTALREAAAQQQKLQQQRVFDQAKLGMDLQEKGYEQLQVDANRPAATDAQGYAIPQEEDPAGFAAKQGRQTITDPYGRQWLKPVPKPEDKLDASNAVPMGRLAQQLEDAGMPGYKSEQFVKPEIYKSLNERLQGKPGAKHLRVDTEHFNQPVLMDEDTGEVKALKLGEGITHNAPKPEKPSKYQFSYHTDDAGTVHVLRGDPESGAVEEVTSIKGAGAKRKDPDAEPKPKPPSASQLRLVTERKNTALRKAEADYRKSTGSDVERALTSPKEALDTLNKAKQSAQDEYEESLGSLLGHEVQHVSYSDQQSAPAPQGAVQAGAGAPPGPPSKSASPLTKQAPKAAAPAKPGSAGTATIGQVQAYAQKHGITLGQALKQAQAEGYAVQGQ